MTTYEAPLDEMQFVIRELGGLDSLTALPEWQDIDAETVSAVLAEANRFASEVLAPLNQIGDQRGVICKDNHVITAPGFREAYQQYINSGWNRLGFDEEYGGPTIPNPLCASGHEICEGRKFGCSACFSMSPRAVGAFFPDGNAQQKK